MNLTKKKLSFIENLEINDFLEIIKSIEESIIEDFIILWNTFGSKECFPEIEICDLKYERLYEYANVPFSVFTSEYLFGHSLVDDEYQHEKRLDLFKLFIERIAFSNLYEFKGYVPSYFSEYETFESKFEFQDYIVNFSFISNLDNLEVFKEWLISEVPEHLYEEKTRFINLIYCNKLDKK